MSDLYPSKGFANREVQREHTYRDENGEPLYRICKLHPRGWMCLRPDSTSASGWTRGLQGVRRVPYRLPELVSDTGGPVWCCEGERDADTAAELGVIATTAASNGWVKTDLSVLRARRCVVVCDHDHGGHKLGLARAVALRKAGALVDDEDIVWPTSQNDLTDLVAVVGPDLHDVLDELRPISESPPAKVARSIEERAGPYSLMPRELLAVSLLARAVFFTLDLLAGESKIAKLSIAAFAEREAISRNRVADAFHELEKAGLISDVRRGTWQVNNPQRRSVSKARKAVPQVTQ